MPRPLTFPALLVMLLVSGCDPRPAGRATAVEHRSFDEDVEFLEAHTDVSVLNCPATSTRVVVAPRFLGAVMTSCPSLENGESFGFIAYNAIERDGSVRSENSNSLNLAHDEGGLDLLVLIAGHPAAVPDRRIVVRPSAASPHATPGSETRFQFEAEGTWADDLGNVSPFHLERVIQILDKGTVAMVLGTPVSSTIRSVAIRTTNLVTNTGKEPWDAARGWIGLKLSGSVKPGAGQILVVPVPVSERPPHLAPDSGDFCCFCDGNAYLKSSGSLDAGNDLIGTKADRLVGLYDAKRGILTFVQTKPATAAGVVFEHVDRSPPPVPVKPGDAVEQTRTTIHFEGTPAELDPIARKVLGVSLAQIEGAFKSEPGISRR